MIWDENEDILVVRCAGKRKTVQSMLDACREERRPYVFLTDKMHVGEIQRILVPVSMLEEEVYKAEICTYLARKTGATLLLMPAHDYGSHAKINTQKIITHIRQVAQRTGENLVWEQVVAKHDSFSLMQEAAVRAAEWNADMVLLTASREYGLDDWLFGPQEQKAILKAKVPVMLVNPRADLFSLCD